MDKSDKPQSVAGETNNTTLTVKRRGRRRHDEAVAGVNAEGVVPSEASAVSGFWRSDCACEKRAEESGFR